MHLEILKRPRIVKTALTLVLILVVCAVLLYMVLASLVFLKSKENNQTKSDVIVVLGARIYLNGEHNPCLISRVNHAINLYKNNYAERILFSGGDDLEDGVNESIEMKKIAIESGIDETKIFTEGNSTSTYENLLFSKEIINRNGLNSTIIVTEPFHLARTELVAKKLDYQYSLSHPQQSSCWGETRYISKYFLKEPFAIFYYFIKGKI